MLFRSVEFSEVSDDSHALFFPDACHQEHQREDRRFRRDPAYGNLTDLGLLSVSKAEGDVFHICRNAALRGIHPIYRILREHDRFLRGNDDAFRETQTVDIALHLRRLHACHVRVVREVSRTETARGVPTVMNNPDIHRLID